MVPTQVTRWRPVSRTIREAVPTSPGRPCIGSWRTRPRTQLGRWAGSVASSSTVARGRAMSIETVYLTSSTLSLGGRGARYSAPSGDANGFGPDPRRAVPESVCDRAGGAVRPWLWEATSSHWPTADQAPDVTPAHAELARRWREMPRVVLSSSPVPVDWNTRLHSGDAVAESRRLKAADGGPAGRRGGARRPGGRVAEVL